MKMLLIFCLGFFAAGFLTSCENRRLNPVVYTNGEIQLTKYTASEISNAYNYIEAKKGDSVEEVMRSGSYGFAGISFQKDTIIIKSLPTVFYKVAKKLFGYTIKVDTT